MVKKQDTMSGRPFVRTFTATTSAPEFFPPVHTNYVQMRNLGAVAVTVYFDTADTSDSTRGFVLAAAGSTGDYYEGPAELMPTNDERYPTRGGISLDAASSTADVTCVFYSRE